MHIAMILPAWALTCHGHWSKMNMSMFAVSNADALASKEAKSGIASTAFGSSIMMPREGII